MKRQVLDGHQLDVPERMPMDGKDIGGEASCFTRYEFASKYTEGMDVVDAACGDGYGSKFLTNAKSYLGVDYSDVALKLCKKQYGNKFKKLNLDTEELPKCDVVISFETIEHLEDPIAYFEKVKLSAKKWFIFSVPNNENLGANPHHKWVFNENDLKHIVNEHFDCEFFHQEVNNGGSVIDKDCYPLFMVGVCKLS